MSAHRLGPLLSLRMPNQNDPARAEADPRFNAGFDGQKPRAALRSSRASIAHAKRHLATFEQELASYIQTQPYALVVDTDAQAGIDRHICRLVKPMPDVLAGIAFDAIGSLRAALDQAGHAIGIAAKTNGKASKFPFGDTLAEASSRASAGSRNIPKDIFDLMIAAKPYKGGNDLLWAMNKLCNTHKHEILIPMCVYAGSNSAQNIRAQDVVEFAFPPRWDSTKNEMVLAVLRQGAKFQMNIQVTYFVSFAKIQGVAGLPANAVLNQLAEQVERILNVVEARAYESGLFID